MPATAPGTVKRRSRDEIEAHSIGLVKKPCRCGHFGIQVQDYYPSRPGDTECVECTRERARAHQRAKRENGGSSVLNAIGHVTRSDPRELTDEEVAARKLLREARAEREGRQGYLYVIGEADAHGNVYIGGNFTVGLKVGFSVNPEARCGELQTGNPRPLVLVAKKQGTLADERELHKRYKAHNIVGEWFEPVTNLLKEFDLA